jgi:hypothetical protein
MKIPALQEIDNNGKVMNMFESTSIIKYLFRKYNCN